MNKNKDIQEIIEIYRNSRLTSLKMFNYVMCYICLSAGIVELIRMLQSVQTMPTVITFFSNLELDIAFSIFIIILGVLVVLCQRWAKVYRVVLFMLTCSWSYLAFSYLYQAIFTSINFHYVMIVPVIAQLLYMMKTSVFLDEDS